MYILSCPEFKELGHYYEITADLLKDEAWQAEFVKAFICERVARIACAANNARVNMTIYLGVRDDGRVQGIRIPRELV